MSVIVFDVALLEPLLVHHILVERFSNRGECLLVLLLLVLVDAWLKLCLVVSGQLN